MPAGRFCGPLLENSFGCQRVLAGVPVPGTHAVAGGVGPVQRLGVRRPRQTVAHSGPGGHHLQRGAARLRPGWQRQQLGRSGRSQLVEGADPKTAVGVCLAVVETVCGHVMQRGGQAGERAAPVRSGVNTVPQGDQQAAPWRLTCCALCLTVHRTLHRAFPRRAAQRPQWCDAAWLRRHRPLLCRTGGRGKPVHAALRNVHPIEPAFVRMPERRLAQGAGR